jgi:hypothetical protein
LLIPTTPFIICHPHIRMSSSSHSKYVCYILWDKKAIHNSHSEIWHVHITMRTLFNLAPTQFNVNHTSSRYFRQFQNLLIMHQIEISRCKILISIGSQNFASLKEHVRPCVVLVIIDNFYGLMIALTYICRTCS